MLVGIMQPETNLLPPSKKTFDLIRPIPGAEDHFFHSLRLQPAEEQLQKRNIADQRHRLGTIAYDGPEARAEAAAENKRPQCLGLLHEPRN